MTNNHPDTSWVQTTTPPDDIAIGDMVTFEILGTTHERIATDIELDGDGKTTSFEYEIRARATGGGVIISREFRWLPVSAVKSVRI